MPRRTTTKGRSRSTKKATARRTTTTAKKKATRHAPTPKSTTDWVASKAFETVNRTIQGLSGTKGNKWVKQWQGWATHFNPQDLISLAQSQRVNWEKDLAHLATNVANTIKHTSEDFIPNGEEVIRDAKRNFCDAYRWVSQNPLVYAAREVVEASKNDLLSLLNIPSQDEVEMLQRKLSTLEQRMTTVMLRGGTRKR